jgi:hypothetical protein
MKRSVLTRRIAIFSVLILAFVGTVTGLNVSLYSASGFVSSYLHALARHDVQGALGMRGVKVPGVNARGVNVPGGASRALLQPGALAELTNIHLISDVDAGASQHDVTYGYLIGGVAARSTFSVTHTGARLAVFSAWQFTRTPISTLQVTPQHGRTFTANGAELVSSAGPGEALALYALAPARVKLSYTSDFFSAATTHALITEVDATVPATVDVQANSVFVKQVQKELDANLAACVTQKVLLPTGCPMGTQITDRIQDDPTWSMTKYPAITIVPGDAEGHWAVPRTEGTAHLVVPVKSIFDGTVSTVDKDVPFTVSYAISFPGGVLTITAQY